MSFEIRYTKNAMKDIKNIKQANLNEKLKSLILIIKENPFQRIKRDEDSGLIIDLGGMKPQYKSNETGEWEEEE